MTTAAIQTNPAWRWIALFGWALVALAFLAFFLLELRLDFLQIQVPCQGEACNWLAISQAEVDVLEAWGLSTLAYAAFTSAASLFTLSVFWLLGGLILWRQGATRIGLAVSLAMIVFPISIISDADNLYASYPNLRVPSLILSSLGFLFVALFIYLFPNGRFYPRWAPLPLGGAILALAVADVLEFQGASPFTPTTMPWELAFLSFALLGVIFQVFRYLWNSTPIERQQTKWTVLGFLFFIFGFPLWFSFYGGVVEIPAGVPRLLGSLGGYLLTQFTILALPITLVIAILRYRLWDIDVIIRRTLVYGALTLTLGLVYFSSVVLLQNLLQAFTLQEQSPLVIVVSTLLIAALFNPLRRRLQNTVDRRFYRRRYDAAQTLEAFAADLRQEVDLDAISEHLLAATAESMQPESVSLWLKPGKGKPPPTGRTL